ncbi:MAG: sensor histidine kinase [Brevundimonas sp.]
MLSRLLAPRHRALVIVAAGLAAAAALAVWFAAQWIDDVARKQTDAAARDQAEKHARVLAGELQKFRLLPLVLSEYPDVHAVLASGAPNAIARLNGKLELLAQRTDAAAIYVISSEGDTLAASNWRQPGSFVGENFGFRPYFQGAMASGEAELFAVGSVTGRPGLFIARRIDDRGKALGVIVVKIDFAGLEAQWARENGRTAIIESHGVVIITGHDSWRFRATRPTTALEKDEIRRTMQFGSLPLNRVDLSPDTAGDLQFSAKDAPYRAAETPVALSGAHLVHFEPVEPARARAAAGARLIVLSAIIVGALAFAIFWRLHMRRLAQTDMQQVLEDEVSLRTAELRQVNERLKSESQRRMAADGRWRAAREELAQANRLSLIGQVTTGVAHEINQPIAAIRACAENTGRLLDRNDMDRAKSNLGNIVELVDRVGKITAEMRRFARRGTPAIQAVNLNEAIEGALLLISDGLRAAGVTLSRNSPADDIRVTADRIRLEQIIINLVQNALEALHETPSPGIAIDVEEDTAGAVRVTVHDNGPGFRGDIAGTLFTPFVTSKPEGLGLGLGIARDIAREFGGSLKTAPSRLGGAAFCITLRRA